MILIDTRAGSSDLVKPLQAMGLPVEPTRLTFGDVAFEGRGVGGAPLLIGVEHKTVSDLVNAITTKRFQGHQLPGMVKTYDRSWLIVEGDWARDEAGRVVMFGKGQRRKPVKGAPPAIELLKMFITFTTRAGVYVWPSPDRRMTLSFLCALYRSWTDKDLDEHRAHLGVYAPDQDASIKIPMSDFRAMIQVRLPGIGFTASKTIEEWVWDNGLGRASWRKLMFKTVDEWAALEVMDRKGKLKRLGQARAEKIVEALQ